MMKQLTVLIATLLLASCAKTMTYAPNNSCAGFAIIKASEKDTLGTLRQVLAHNKTYRAICEKESQPNE